ncbi:hypothetical protein HDU83_006887 [Entophlyctis luteolus]|nr:hypothetical protein HDU83_006887 [Entophlyctis luteolus]
MKPATLLALLAAAAPFVSAAKKCAPAYEVTVDVATTTDNAPAPAAQAEVDSAAADTTAEESAAAVTTDAAPAPAAQSEVDVATTADVVVAVVETTAAGDTSASSGSSSGSSGTSGDIADSNIPTVTAVGTPSTNGCNSNNLAVCAVLAQSDYQSASEAAASVGSDFNQACLDLNNHARKFYGNPNPYLVWNEDLANWAVVSAAYANTLQKYDAHSYSGGSYPWGQNLYVGEATCAEAYYGWVTSEALGGGSTENGHFLNQAGWVSSDGGAYTQVGCGAYGDTIVCNYGLSDVSGALASMPTDYVTALALALEGVVYAHWDTYYPGGTYDALARRGSSSAKSIPSKHAPGMVVNKTPRNVAAIAPAAGAAVASKTLPGSPPHHNGGIRPTNGSRATNGTGVTADVQKKLADVSAQAEQMKNAVLQVEKERDFYFGKLQEIEVLVAERIESKGASTSDIEAWKEIQNIMYKTEEGFEPPSVN